MTKEELAKKLDGNEYLHEVSKEIVAEAKEAGLVIVYGQSDDLIEFVGAIDEEVGAWEGTTVLVDTKGLLPERESIEDDETLEDFFKRKKDAMKIQALWAEDDDFSWTYKTSIPHVTFNILEDSEPYCRGIVFALKDCVSKRVN